MKRWEAWTNHASWALTAATGIVYGVLRYFVASPDPDSRLAQPWQPTLLAAHVLVAPIAVFGFGLLFRRHAWQRWVSGFSDGRRTGTILLASAAPLILSGYVLQVLTGEAARRWTGWAHAAIGVALAVAYLFHPRNPSPEEPENGVSPPRAFRSKSKGNRGKRREAT